MLTLATPLSRISGIGPRFLVKFKRLRIETVSDLLYHFPSRYEDFSEVYPIADLEPGQQATVQGIVEEIETHHTWRRHMTVVTAVIRDDTGTVNATWFNQPYVKNILKPGARANFSGKVARSDHELYLSHPTYERVDLRTHHETRHTARLVPVYPETYGLTSKGIRFIMQPILEHLGPIEEWIPEDVLRTENLPALPDALRTIHFPRALDDAMRARARFAFEDLFLLQFANRQEKARLAARRAPALRADIDEIKRVLASLPFPLTFSQKKSLWEIIKDIEKPHPMNRLLQGDVGSGKTVVAALAALIAARNGYQAAFMAPTEVLARQHYETLKTLFAVPGGEGAGGADGAAAGARPVAHVPPFALLTASGAKVLHDDGLEHSVKQSRVREELKKGEVAIVVGTHALIAEGTSRARSASRVSARAAGRAAAAGGILFKKLGLVIIDEQHRFGVSQRAKLSHGASGRGDASGGARSAMLPHFLSMSATPIPRTLMLTLFGDLDISTIAELPSGRGTIVTKIVPPAERAATYEFAREEIKKGRQAFVICPRIAASEAPKNGGAPAENEPRGARGAAPARGRLFANGAAPGAPDLASVEEEYERLRTDVFPEFKIAMLHGQMKPAEKERIMRDFRSGAARILVSTSVIEVGVDVPNASVMMIEGSDCFGLAQLYQFRGRVGRGAHESYCFLFSEHDASASSRRQKAIVEAKNGFELAEKDLELRGPGEFLGQKQTGLPDYAMRGIQNLEFIRRSRDAAARVLARDPHLAHHPLLAEKALELERRLHLE